MSLTVFPCHSPADERIAREITRFLEASADVSVFFEESAIRPGEHLFARVREGRMAEAILVLLSPEASPERWPLAEWTAAFLEEPEEFGVALAVVLVRECRFPELLRRRNFFVLGENPRAGFRSIKRWLLELRGPVRPPRLAPARVPVERVAEASIEALDAALADAPGRVTLDAGAGQTLLALEFARRRGGEFEDVFWLAGADRGLAALAGDLGAQLGLKLDGEARPNVETLREILGRRRYLLILDAVESEHAERLSPAGRASVLRIAGEGGAAELAHLSPEARGLLSAMAVCAPGGCALELAAEVAEMDLAEASRAASELASCGAAAALDGDGLRWYRPAPVRRAAPRDAGLARRHAGKAADLPEVQQAFRWAFEHRADPEAWELARSLARRGAALARGEERLAEAYELLRAAHDAAEAREDRRALEECAWEMVWILERWDRLEEARELDRLRREHYADQMCFEF